MLTFLSCPSAVIPLDPRLQIPLDVCHYHLRSSRYSDDCAIAKGVRRPNHIRIMLHSRTCPPTHDRKDKIIWECNHGGQVWSSNAEYAAKSSFPVGFCSAGFDSLNAAFIVSLLVDLVFQVRSPSDHGLCRTCPQF
jgi:hypothetical protein